MRYGICVPNLAEFSDPRRVAAREGRDGDGPFDVVITGRTRTGQPA
jgi:hypothetical protein